MAEETKVYVMKVKSATGKQWWMITDGEDDLYKSTKSKRLSAVMDFCSARGLSIGEVDFQSFKGAMSPAEAVVTVVDIVKGEL